MVTIEQKLLLFSKLLNQSMDKKFEEEFKEMEKYYKEQIQKIKDEVKNEIHQIEEKAKISGEMRLAQYLSKSRVNIKKEIMRLNEKYYDIFMAKFKSRLKSFVASDDYLKYLKSSINDFNKNVLDSYNSNGINNIAVYLNGADLDRYSEFIRQEISKNEKARNIKFIVADNIIGGLIIEIPENNFKVTMTVDSVLEENKPYIMQTLFDALEAGVL